MLHNHLRISRLRKAYRISFLFNPTSFSPTRTAEHLIGAARSLGIDLTRVDAQSPADLAGAFAKMSQAGVVAALVDADAMFFSERAYRGPRGQASASRGLRRA